MNVSRAISIDDLRILAKKHLPKLAFDYIEGGVDGETCLIRNEEAFGRYCLVPRYLVDVSKRSQLTELLGVRYDSPFGIAPNGMAGLWRPGADDILAQAAANANIPFLLSGASSSSIERVMKIAPQQIGFQLYGARDPQFTEKFLRRAQDAGVRSVVLTVDVPVASKRERNIRNGFNRPPKISLGMVWDGLSHPSWLLGFLRQGGIPAMGNWVEYAPAGATPDQIADFFASQTPASGQTWDDVHRFRTIWPHNLIIKGILHPDDALRAVACGADGIIVSNHGGRQLDTAPAPIDVLPAIRKAVGDTYTVMLDSGIRRGSDIVLALCLGADFVFVGRALIYGMAAGGLTGAEKAIDILRRELDLVMGQMGCASVGDFNPDKVLPATLRTE